MTLPEVLRRCRELVAASSDAMYSNLGVSEILATLDRGNLGEIELLFAPTACIQETSIDNGWAEEYLLRAQQFDALIA